MEWTTLSFGQILTKDYLLMSSSPLKHGILCLSQHLQTFLCITESPLKKGEYLKEIKVCYKKTKPKPKKPKPNY